MKVKKVREMKRARSLVSMDAKRRVGGVMRHRNARRWKEKQRRIEDD